MSRRRERGSGRTRPTDSGPAQRGQPGPPRDAPGGVAPGRRPPRLPFVAQVGVLVAVFAVVSLIADLVGAANLGVALGIGVIAFAIALVVMIVKN